MSGGAPQEEGRINGSDTAVQKAKKNAQRKKDHKSMADLQQIEDLFKTKGNEMDHRKVMDAMNDLDKAVYGDGGDLLSCSTKVAVKDAGICVRAGQVSVKVSRDMTLGSQQFLVAEFLTKILQRYGKDVDADEEEGQINIDWERFRTEAAQYFDATPSCTFLASEMLKNAKPKEKKGRQASQRRHVEESQPDYGTKETDEAVKKNSKKREGQLCRQLAKDKEMPIVDFVINPNSFGETVENLFACSCLISEGEAGLKDDGNGTMLLTKEVAPTNTEDNQDRHKRCIMKFDFAMFRELIEDREIRQAHYKFDPNEEDVSIGAWEEDEDEASMAQTLPKRTAGGSQSQRASKKRRS